MVSVAAHHADEQKFISAHNVSNLCAGAGGGVVGLGLRRGGDEAAAQVTAMWFDLERPRRRYQQRLFAISLKASYLRHT
jgi:hypothetical protein